MNTYADTGAKGAMMPSFAAKANRWDNLLTKQVNLFAHAECEFFASSKEWLSSQSVADIGCGNGEYLRALAQRFPEKRYVGVDQSAELIRLAQERHSSKLIEFQTLDLAADGLEDKFDSVILRFVVQHLDRPAEFFLALSRCCKSSTSIFVIEPDLLASFARPELTRLRTLFSDYAAECVASGRSRSIIKDTESFSAFLEPHWSIVEHRLVRSRYIRRDMPVEHVRDLFEGWIAAIQQAGTVCCDFESVRAEVEQWINCKGQSIEFGLNIWVVQQRK